MVKYGHFYSRHEHEAGKTYFVRRLARYYPERVAVLDLTQINEDEGRYWFP